MGLFGFSSKKKSKKKEQEDIVALGTGVVAIDSVNKSVQAASEKFAKPDYNRNTRPKFYDNKEAKDTFKNNAFADGIPVRDVFTGNELKLTQYEAQQQYGDQWAKYAVDVDHTKPLEEIYRENKNNPFLTAGDIKDVANREENFEILSRSVNASKQNKSNSDWLSDESNIEKYNISEANRKRAILAEERAEKFVKKEITKKTVRNVIETGHKAGLDSVKSSLIMGGTISTLHNFVLVIQGDKNPEEAAISIAKDTAKIIPTVYAIGSAGSVVKSAMINVPSKAVQKIASTNLPESIIALAITSTQTIGDYFNGNVTGQQCTLELGEKSLVFATSSTSMGIGTKVAATLNGGTIGVVGGTIGAAAGALVGAAIIGAFCDQISDYVLNHHLRQEERQRLIAEYNYAAKQERAFRSELETYIEAYFKEYRTCFDQAWIRIEESFKEGDADGVIAGANQITKKLGGKVQYETVDEFKSFLDDDSQDFIL